MDGLNNILLSTEIFLNDYRLIILRGFKNMDRNRLTANCQLNKCIYIDGYYKVKQKSHNDNIIYFGRIFYNRENVTKKT